MTFKGSISLRCNGGDDSVDIKQVIKSCLLLRLAARTEKASGGVAFSTALIAASSSTTVNRSAMFVITFSDQPGNRIDQVVTFEMLLHSPFSPLI